MQQEFIIKVYRGPFSDETWTINKRYNDFYKLHTILQTSGLSLELPPKKIIGNMDPHFISERQQGLQVISKRGGKDNTRSNTKMYYQLKKHPIFPRIIAMLQFVLIVI